MKLSILVLFSILLCSCNIIGDFFYTNTGSDFLEIGQVQDDSFMQHIYNPPYVHNMYSKPFELDVDGDSIMDFRITSAFDHVHGQQWVSGIV